MSLNDPNTSRLVLGTAQFGMDYGITNQIGKPDLRTVEMIIKTAWEGGIREFDTAQGYGESETVLGKALHGLGISDEVKIISKFHPKINHVDGNLMHNALKKTLTSLRIPRLYGILLHREEILNLWDKGLAEILLGFVEAGLVEHVGVSVCSPHGALQALATDGISIVQFPSNLWDRRFERAGIFQLAGRKGKQVYVRSIFLQGILLQSSADIPAHMAFARPTLQKLDLFLNKTGLTNLELALGYVKSVYAKAKIIFGAETQAQVQNNLASWGQTLPRDILEKVKATFERVEETIVNPILWPN